MWNILPTLVVVLQYMEHYDHISCKITIYGFLNKTLAPKYEWIVEWVIKRPKVLSNLINNPY